MKSDKKDESLVEERKPAPTAPWKWVTFTKNDEELYGIKEKKSQQKKKTSRTFSVRAPQKENNF